MSARLCVETPPTRTLGDDLESFALLLLWLSGKYAENTMSPPERARFLRRFDSLDGDGKADMFGLGSTMAVRLRLSSKNLRYLLAGLLEGYRYRYTELLEQGNEMPHELAAHEGALAERIEQRQARLENHEWLMGLLSEALKDEEWKASSDPSRKQEVTPLNQREGVTKRKSACSEYELANASKRLRLAEYNGTEEDDGEDVDTEDYEDDGEGEDEDEQNDNDGDNDEVEAKED